MSTEPAAVHGDLWECALNVHPKGLASLNGKESLFGKSRQNGPDQRRESSESKSIALDVIQEYNFDIYHRMGTILRRRYDFGRLAGIRRAYAAAFCKDVSLVEKALKSPALDSLSTTRNLLTHKAGVIDAEYLRRVKGQGLPAGNIGERIMLDGESVAGLIKPALEAGANLIDAVDAWLQKN